MKSSRPLTLCLLLAIVSSGVRAVAEDAVVEREFGYLTPLTAPDFTSNDSIGIVNMSSDETGFDRFITDASVFGLPNIPQLAGSGWASTSTMHVTTAGPAGGVIVWRISEGQFVPSAGAWAKSGPNSDVTVLGRYWVRLVNNSTLCAGDCGWLIVGVDDGVNPPPLGASGLFIHAKGRFNR